MNNIANINILSGDHNFPYLVEYIKGSEYSTFNFVNDGLDILFKTELVRSLNIWKRMTNESWEELTGVQSSIRIYFPEHSVESLKSQVHYILDIYTYIGSTKIVLGSALMDRLNALATTPIKYYQNIGYYEYIDIPIIDPYNLIYSDDFTEFRKSLKQEDMNNDCSILYCDLHIVEENEKSWIPDSDFDGGFNMIQISHKCNDFLNYSMKWTGTELIGEIKFNDSYKSDLDSYLWETYSINPDYLNITYMLTVNGAIDWVEIKSQDPNIIFNKEFIRKSFNIDNWNNWEEGLSFMSTAIISVSQDEDEKLILKSNKIQITQDIFSKLLIPDDYKIDTSKYFDEHMNINVINTIKQSTTLYNIPDNSKSNIIVPVFYKVHDLGSIVLHPEVNENICINLDAYKSKVESFILQVEGVKFNEIGTTHSGTIFKVVGPNLPAEKMEGTYYILSQDGELITNGKYIYEL